MARLTSRLIDTGFTLLLPAVIIFHLLIAPYTKVEESFNIQATHDIIVYGIPRSNIYERLSKTYDHFSFPGAVPRTFVGSLLLASFSEPFIGLVGFQHAQTVVRLTLGLFNAWALSLMKRNIQRTHGSGAARWFAVLQASQFHIPFYASRTLPNMFAFGLTTWAYSLLLPPPPSHSHPSLIFRRQRLSLTLLIFASTIFRSEIALLLATTTLYLLLAPESHLAILLPAFLISMPMALLISVPLDSLLWQRPLWPELWGFYYNAILGSSSNWGTSPAWWYFTSALPRLLLNPLTWLVLIPLAWRNDATRQTTRRLVVPSLLFVALYSAQPHKEARFIFYVVPALTAAAALGADYVFTRRSKSVAYRIGSIVLVGSVLASFAASVVMGVVSSLNYPGGEALAYLRGRVEDGDVFSIATEQGRKEVRVHADVLSCMTGVTLFGTTSTGSPLGQKESSVALGGKEGDGVPASRKIILDKTEDPALLSSPDFWSQFDYILTEDPADTDMGRWSGWDEMAVVEGYAGVEVLRPGSSSLEGGGVPEDQRRKVVGKGKMVADVRDWVRSLTGGWWVGPKMVPKVWVLRRHRTGL